MSPAHSLAIRHFSQSGVAGGQDWQAQPAHLPPRHDGHTLPFFLNLKKMKLTFAERD